MPGLNRKGPEGQGPRSGRGLGKCNPGNRKNDGENFAEDGLRGSGRGLGRRRTGLGKRCGSRHGNAIDKEE